VNVTAKAFAPAAISSFFEIHYTQSGKSTAQIERIGAVGGGFGLQKGVYTQVTVTEADKNAVIVSINGEVNRAKTTTHTAKILLSHTNRRYHVQVDHTIEVPIGMGFGTSAGGALTTGLALREILALPLTYNQIGTIAHKAEIQCLTGLGTVSSLTFSGGCVLVVEPGAPGICKIDRIPINPDYVIVVGYYPAQIPKKSVLSSPEKKREISRHGKKTLATILSEPCLANFLNCCWDFAQKTHLATDGICKLVAAAKKAGAIGAAQNMIGQAVHAVVDEKNAWAVEEAFREILPQNQVFTSRIDFQGARLVK